MVDVLYPTIWDALLLAAQLLLTGMLYSGSLTRREHFALRAVAAVGLYLLLCAALPALPLPLGLLPIPIYLLYLLTSFALFKLDAKLRCFFFLAVMSTHHMAVALIDGLWMLLRVPQGSPAWMLVGVLGFALTLAGCYLAYGRQMRRLTQVDLQSGRLILLACVIFAVAYLLRIFSVFEAWELPPGNPLRVTVHLYSAVSCLAALTILFMGNHEDALAEEKRLIEQLLRERESQERITGEVIELVNMKYHDMKHLLRALRAEGGDARGALDEAERELPRYERVLHTGSAALDTVLASRMELCEARGIALNCMADGKRAELLSAADLYALFGNLLDNAIEAVQSEAPERRAIALQVFAKRGWLCIHAENYCAHPPELVDGLPRTTKGDGRYHGFGIKSVRYIAEKYGGHMTISAQNESFSVDILIPIS